MITKEITRGQDESVSSSLKKLRVEIVNITSTIGTKIPDQATETEKLQTSLLGSVAEFEDKLPIESLYAPVAPEADAPNTLKIINVLKEYRKHLLNAQNNYENETAREIEMTLFRNIVFEFDYIEITNSNFRDAITALKAALFSASTSPYSKEKIKILVNIIGTLKNNIVMSDHVLHDISDMLDDHFNVAAPLSGLQLVE